MKLHLISAPQKMALWMSHTNTLTCSIIYILYFHHFCVYPPPEKVAVAICRCFAVLQSPENRKSGWAHRPLPSSVFLHCYLYMQHLETTVRITIPLYLCNWTVETAAEWDAADGNAKMLHLVRVSCKFLPEWEFMGEVSLCKIPFQYFGTSMLLSAIKDKKKESLSS